MRIGRESDRLQKDSDAIDNIPLSTFPQPDDLSKLDTKDSYASISSSQDEAPFVPTIKSTRKWRTGVLICATCALVVFLINLVATIWTLTTHGIGLDGRQILFEGNCEAARKLNSGIHLLINVLSTILLSSSNYCMQCLSAATRQEINEAHAKGVWLDVGVPSFRNLRRIKRKRIVLWWLLGVSSLPLHLFYNSAVFSSIMQQEYDVVAVDQSFETAPVNTFEKAYFNVSESAFGNISNYGYFTFRDPAHAYPNKSAYLTNMVWRMWTEDRDLLQRLSPSQCISAYAHDIITDRRDVILVLDTKNGSGPTHIFDSSFSKCDKDRYQWICGQDGYDSCIYTSANRDSLKPTARRCKNRLPRVRSSSQGWAPADVPYKVDHCWSRLIPEKCKVQFSHHLVVVVLVLNFVKAVLMYMTAFGTTDPPVLTIGDAVASFLANPDPYTNGMSLTSKMDVVKEKNIESLRRPRTFTSTRKRWFIAASRTRWSLCILLYICALGICAAFLIMGTRAIQDTLDNTDADFGALLKLGIGAISPLTLISWPLPSSGAEGLVLNVLVANAAQPILSFLYFSYNGLFTSLFVAHEWESFSRKTKGLRVSAAPTGHQRSTYFLQLPYRLALPLMVTSGVLHWLVSQSIFLVNMQSPAMDIQEGFRDNLTCGYSPVAIFCVIMIGIAKIIFVLAMGMQRYKSGMPVASSCSFAIAAACHHYSTASDLRNESFQRVRWGDTGHNGDGLPHCGFSSGEVNSPIEGRLYS